MPNQKPERPAIFHSQNLSWHFPIAGITVLERNVRAAISANVKPCIIVSDEKPPERIQKLPHVKWTNQLDTAQEWGGQSALRFEGNFLYERAIFEKMADGSIRSKIQTPIEWRLPIDTKEGQVRAQQYLNTTLTKKNDGLFRRLISRKISLMITHRLAQTSITPNMITVTSFIMGLVSTVFIAHPSWSMRIVGGALLLVHFIIDSCDGELSRLRFETSKRGGTMDFWSDNIIHVALFLSMGIGLWREGWGTLPLILGAIAAFFSITSAALAWRTVSQNDPNKTMMTGVVNQNKLSSSSKKLASVLDLGAGRDFLLLIFAAALINRLDLVLWVAAIGTPIYFLMLSYTSFKAKK